MILIVGCFGRVRLVPKRRRPGQAPGCAGRRSRYHRRVRTRGAEGSACGSENRGVPLSGRPGTRRRLVHSHPRIHTQNPIHRHPALHLKELASHAFGGALEHSASELRDGPDPDAERLETLVGDVNAGEPVEFHRGGKLSRRQYQWRAREIQWRAREMKAPPADVPRRPRRGSRACSGA